MGMVDDDFSTSRSDRHRQGAPDPARGHYYMEVVAYDSNGQPRVLEDSHLAEHGWGTASFWTRSREDIWRYTISDRVGEVDRNRTWYLRGVCAREVGRGEDAQRCRADAAALGRGLGDGEAGAGG